MRRSREIVETHTIVEFLGLPGAGKTTVANALAKRMAENDSRAVALPDRAEYRRKELSLADMVRLDVAYAIPFLDYRLRRLLYDIHNARPGLWTIKNSWNQSRYPIVLMDVMRRAPRPYYILDEWLVHRTIDESIRRYSARFEFSMKFALPRLAPYRLVYVFLNVDAAVAFERIMRQDNPFRKFARKSSAEDLQSVLAQWDRHLRHLRPAIAARGIECVELDGRDPVDVNAQLVSERLVAGHHDRQSYSSEARRP